MRSRLVAIQHILPSVIGRWPSLGLFFAQTLTGGMFDSYEHNLMRFDKAQAVYIPVWDIESVWSLKCNDRRHSTMSFATSGSMMPGNAWEALRFLPLRPPPHRVDYTSVLPVTGPKDPATYAPFSRERHLNPEVEVEGGISVVPFNISPLQLPGLIRSASPGKLAIDFGKLGETRRFNLFPGVQVEVSTNTGNTDQPLSKLEFDGSSLSLDMFACFPVMLPVHLVSFKYDANGEKDLRATVAFGAWDERLLACSLKPTHDEEWGAQGNGPWLAIHSVDMDPAPVYHHEVDHYKHLPLATSAAAQKLALGADWESYRNAEAARQNNTETDMGTIEWDSPHVRSMVEDFEGAEAYAIASANAFYTQFTSRLIENSASEDIDSIRVEHDGRIFHGDDAIESVRVRNAAAQRLRKESRPSWLE
ncbi:hypothetical protein MCUN1_001325 [Malassezia cuniculi]|uniref:Uncharacterized protein n=1 Tax=Malassezia cuniculi TaxID=948313 RepID=A0AAF0J6F1_9BASI|nr:hypothetical protein MCUN1_001325 [Malassezia cuniculi]